MTKITVEMQFEFEDDRVPIEVAAQITGVHAEIIRLLIRDGVVSGNAPHRTRELIGSVDIRELQHVANIIHRARELAPNEDISVPAASAKYGFSDVAIYRWIKDGWLSSNNRRIPESEMAYAKALADLPSNKPRRRVFPQKPA